MQNNEVAHRMAGFHWGFKGKSEYPAYFSLGLSRGPRANKKNNMYFTFSWIVVYSATSGSAALALVGRKKENKKPHLSN